MLTPNQLKTKNTSDITTRVLLFIFNLVQVINGIEPPDLTFVIKKSDTNSIEPVCFAEGNALHSAVGWIYPTVDSKDKLPKIVSSYVPDLKNDYDCNFSKTSHCSNSWKMEDWQYSKFDSHCFRPTLDTRWEKFQTLVTSNITKEFNAKIEIPPVFQTGISVRASNNAEIFLCEGWNPYNYPCYYINIGSTDNRQAFLRKYKTIPDKFSKNDTKLSKYKSDVGLLFDEEWKHFALSLDDNGTIKLSDINKDTTLLNFTDKEPFKPHYLFIRSKFENALWKIHYNQYIFTNKTRATQLGPTFGIYGNDLCISLYVSMCKNCKMTFFLMQNRERSMLKEVSNENESDELSWKEIRLIKNNILDDKIQLFVETKYTNSMESRNGFWAIDDVRICAENEIKITRLVTKMDLSEAEKSQLSCQLLDIPSWRPHQFTSVTNTVTEDIKYNSSTSTSIRLSWKASASNENLFQEYYIVQYEAEDICSHEDGSNSLSKNKNRQRSQGYVVGKSNDIVLQNLIPYTNYNITFWSLVQENKKSYKINTLPTDKPTKDELPRNFVKTLTDNTAKIEWDNPKCNETYGPVVYQIHVKRQDGNDYNSTLLTDVKTKYVLKELQPYTNYTAEIRVARKVEYLNDTHFSIKTICNFTTLPGIAPKVENLEVYATDKHSASLRFDLPNNLKGVPKLVQVQWCHPLFIKGCHSDIRNLTKCKLWDNKYCIDIETLTVGYDFAFRISIKNDKTHKFGDESIITGTTLDRVPGTPSNIKYQMIACDKTKDYCHLNVSWAHPYQQNGTINLFDIVLNESSYTFVEDAFKIIHENLRIPNKKYQPIYFYVIKYIPFNTPYKLSIRAENDVYKGKYASVNIKTDHIANYLDQTPTFVTNTNETIVFKLPPRDWRLRSSTLIVIVQDYDTAKTNINEEIIQLEMFEDENQLCNTFGETWIAKTANISNDEQSAIVIGDETTSYLPQINKLIVNRKLKSDTEYCVTFTLINQYRDSQTVATYHERHIFTEPNYTAIPHHKNEEKKVEESTNVAAYLVPILFIILLLASGAWLTYRYRKRRNRNNTNDHIYESMPFDDYLPNAVSNQAYDKLIHT